MWKLKLMKVIHVITLIIVSIIAIITTLYIIDDLAFANVIGSIMHKMNKEVEVAAILAKMSKILPIVLISGLVILIIEEVIYRKIFKKARRIAEGRKIKLSRKNEKLFSDEAPKETVTVTITKTKPKKEKHKKEKVKEVEEKTEEKETGDGTETTTINIPVERSSGSSQSDLDAFLKNLTKK